LAKLGEELRAGGGAREAGCEYWGWLFGRDGCSVRGVFDTPEAEFARGEAAYFLNLGRNYHSFITF
jgi:hypothetical protein